MSDELSKADVLLTGEPVAEIDVVLLTLTALADMWEEEADRRGQGASTSVPFGPRMMILAAEGSVMLACAGQLREAIKIARAPYRKELDGR